MTKKPRFTLEQHEKMGLELHSIREKVASLRHEISVAYPKNIYSYAIKAQHAIDELRNVLDNCVHAENPGGSEPIRCYYRKNRQD